ncbi:MAG TPA: hypothetical protein VLT36_17285 [Candidatus Dormibacteraeota bacterium]|nr:hypothetical protein [Candidatus Dormibacteraeota bacterium]
MAQRRIRKNINTKEDSFEPKELESFKTFLGPIAARYSDPQLVQLRSDMHAAAHLLLDLYILKSRRPNKPTKISFDNPEIGT